MVGNDWAIARSVHQQEDSNWPGHFLQALFWKRVGGGEPSKFERKHSSSLGGQNGLSTLHQSPAGEPDHRRERLQQRGQDCLDSGRWKRSSGNPEGAALRPRCGHPPGHIGWKDGGAGCEGKQSDGRVAAAPRKPRECGGAHQLHGGHPRQAQSGGGQGLASLSGLRRDYGQLACFLTWRSI